MELEAQGYELVNKCLGNTQEQEMGFMKPLDILAEPEDRCLREVQVTPGT